MKFAVFFKSEKCTIECGKLERDCFVSRVIFVAYCALLKGIKFSKTHNNW